MPRKVRLKAAVVGWYDRVILSPVKTAISVPDDVFSGGYSHAATVTTEDSRDHHGNAFSGRLYNAKVVDLAYT